MASRHKPGQIRDAIVEVLSTIGREARLADIESAVSSLLGAKVPPSSVRSYLRLNTGSLFDRSEKGTYALSATGTGPARVEPTEISKPAFRIGRVEYYAADCLDWLAQRPPRSLHAVITDPPYGLVEYSRAQQQKLRSGRGGVWRIPPSFDGHRRSPLPRFTTLRPAELVELRGFFRRWACALLPVLVPGAHVMVASNPLLSYAVADEIVRAGFERRGEIIRLVMTMRGGDRPKNAHREFEDVTVMPRSMWEPWLLFRKPLEGRVQDNLRKWGTGGLRRPDRNRPFGDVIRSSPTNKRERLIAPHPSLKPQAFLRQLVRAVLPLGNGIILDPFAGSGSTLAAAEVVGLTSIGVERDPDYVELAKKAIPRLAALELSPSEPIEP